MSGPTLAMASAVESTHAAPFQHSHSSPDLLSSLAKPPPSIASLSHHHRTLSCKSLPSLPAFDVPSFDLDLDFDTALVLDTKPAASVRVSASEKALLGPAESRQPAAVVTAAVADTDHLLSRKKSLIDRPRSWIPGPRSSAPSVGELVLREPEVSRKGYGGTAGAAGSSMAETKAAERSRTVSESFADFARRSWISTSRSPSPKGRVEEAAVGSSSGEKKQRERSGSSGSPGPRRKLPRKRLAASVLDSDANQSAESLSSTSRALNRASVYLTRIKQRPQSVFVRNGAPNPSSQPTHSSSSEDPFAVDPSLGLGLSPSPSLDNHNNLAPSTATEPTTVAAEAPQLPPIFLSEATTLPRVSSQTAVSSDGSVDSANGSTLPASASETGSQTTADTSPMARPAGRDPLWIAFKDLEANYLKFLAKNTTSQRMIIVRATLIPFLRRYAYTSSDKDTKHLAPEDVERRATILNKWWNGLLELLDGQNGPGASTTNLGSAAQGLQPVAGVDRPNLLEATTMIMTRPEWRLNTPVFRPLADRSPGEKVRARSNTMDSKPPEEAGSAFLEESAEHNVRHMFLTNLLAQMTLVVDKMSTRHAPLSLVSFSGKACAYAFFFVPGVADVLVRLWGLDKKADLIRRMADAFDLPRRSKGESEDIIALFPPNIGPLGWSSVSTMSMKLKRPAKLSLQAAKIPWHGPWVTRWRGGDTDLFFIFCKYYFILADEFMPSELPLVEKARAPAFVLLHAQMLHILDSTIHRQAAVEAMMGSPLLDALQGPDAAITALPPLLPPNNLFRGMDENRVIVLLRDFLTTDGPMAGARHTFAESIMAVLKAATRKTSQFDHNACYMLCDFMHEALSALDAYFGYSMPANQGETVGQRAVDYVDWPFWLDVCRMILASNNTMSEVRVLSFVFSAWDIIAADAKRKEELCLNWLLTEEVFEKFFNNWCPMVRAYYMRLLCWRMCRDAGSANELDAKIFLLVSQRLKTVWSHYLWLKQKADREGTLQPSTAPSLPQPGKRFMIVRTEIGVPQPGLFVSFDSMPGSHSSPAQATPDYRSALYGSGGAIPSLEEKKADNNPSSKKKWSLLGKVLNFSSSPTSAGVATNGGAKLSYDEQFDQVRRDIASSRSPKAQSFNTQTSSSSAPPPPPKMPSSSAAPSSDSDSTGSSPVYDAAQFVFKFTLHNIPWQAGPLGLAPPLLRDRILTRPRLPAPAQSRVSARFASSGRRSESPPPPAAGLPPPTRRVSGLMLTGLVSEAKNANPAESVPPDASSDSGARRSVGSRTSSNDSRSTPVSTETDLGLFAQDAAREGDDDDDDNDISDMERGRERVIIQPLEPKGAFVITSKYAGRALAEWSIVVGECNSFVDRRREEGVLGLRDVEVPSLGVDGLRRLA